MHVMLGLLGLKIGELHGDLSQTQVNYLKKEIVFFCKSKFNFL